MKFIWDWKGKINPPQSRDHLDIYKLLAVFCQIAII